MDSVTTADGLKVGQPENPIGTDSKSFTFKAPLAAGQTTEPTKFFMWADMGTDQYNSLAHFGNINNALALTKLATSMLLVRCSVLRQDDLHSRMPLSFMPLLHLTRCACDQWHSSWVFTPLTGWHCKLRPHTEGR
jgi:hypothetical protein